MTPSEKKLIAALLELASAEFSDHGCTDFDLSEVMPDPDERRNLMKAYHEFNGDPEEFNPEGSYSYGHNWVLMTFMAKRILQD